MNDEWAAAVRPPLFHPRSFIGLTGKSPPASIRSDLSIGALVKISLPDIMTRRDRTVPSFGSAVPVPVTGVGAGLLG